MKQRRILTSTLQDLHTQYNENSDEMHRMSYRQFTRYKPFYITEPKPCDRNTCACHQHENMRLLITTISKRGLITTTSLSTLLSSICCSTNNDLCMRRQCTECCFELVKVRAHDPAESVTWEQWQKEDVTVGEKTYKNWVKRTKRGSVGNLLEVFQKDLEELAEHHYNWIHQVRQFQHLKENLQSNEMVLHIDFSENYACKLNTEIQAFHFGGNRQQATLHTGMAYGTRGSLSYATVSQSLRHAERAVWAHIKPVLENFKGKSDHDIDTLHILSDGPATQYRNRTNCFLLSTVPYTLGFTKITWNFSERSHGKGAPDGVGGALKRCADKYVHGGGDLQTPKDLFNYLQDNTEKVNIRWVEDYEIVGIDGLLPPTVCPVVGIGNTHQVLSFSPGEIFYRRLSCFCQYPEMCPCFQPKKLQLTASNVESTSQDFTWQPNETTHPEYNSDSDDDTSYTVGKFVIVTYDARPYVGQIMNICGNEAEINCMKNSFIWPNKTDCIFYSCSQIACSISEPEPLNRSAKLSDIDWRSFNMV